MLLLTRLVADAGVDTFCHRLAGPPRRAAVSVVASGAVGHAQELIAARPRHPSLPLPPRRPLRWPYASCQRIIL